MLSASLLGVCAPWSAWALDADQCGAAAEQIQVAQERASRRQFRAAARALEAAIAVCERFGAWHLLGGARAELGDDVGASRAFVRAAELATDDTDRANALARLAEVLARNQHPDLAAQHVDVALRLLAEPPPWLAAVARRVDDALLARTLTTKDVRRGLGVDDAGFARLPPVTELGAGAGAVARPALRVAVGALTADGDVDAETQARLALLARELSSGRFGGLEFEIGFLEAGSAAASSPRRDTTLSAIARRLADLAPELAGRLHAPAGAGGVAVGSRHDWLQVRVR